MSETLYRCENRAVDQFRQKVVIRCYFIQRRTARGAWISAYGSPKWVSLHTRKRFAHPTVEEAKKAFRARKKRQVLILRTQLEAAKLAAAVPEDQYEFIQCVLR